MTETSAADDPRPRSLTLSAVPCYHCDELTAHAYYCPWNIHHDPAANINAAEADELADELEREYVAAVIRRQDRTAALATLARGYRDQLTQAHTGPLEAGRQADRRYAGAMLAPFRGSGADRAQAHGRYMFGLIVAARRDPNAEPGPIDRRQARETLRHALTDWNAATDDQRAAALAAAERSANP